MWKTIRKGLWARKRRLISTSIAVVLGVAFLAATLATGDTMRGGFDTLFNDANAGTDVVVRNATEFGSDDLAERGTLDASLSDEIAAVDGVAAIAPMIEGSGQIIAADGDPLGGGGPPTTAGNWVEDPSLNPYQLAEGRAPKPTDGGVYEVVIDRASADDGELEIGDRTTVKTPEVVEVEIVGIATFGDADSLGPTTYAGFDDAAAVELFGEPGQVSELRVAAAEGTDDEALRTAIAGVLPAEAEALTGSELSDEQLDDINGDFLNMFETILLAFAGIALVVASFSIHNTFSILVAQRTRESALLRAIGASRRQVVTSVVVEALAIGVVASAVGLIGGYGLAAGLKSLMGSSGIDLPGSVVLDSGTVVIAAAVGVIVTLFASIVPAIKASRVAPLEALRDAAVDRASASRVRGILGAVVTAGGVAVVATSTSSADGALQQAGLGALATLIGAVMLGPVVARPAASVLGAGLSLVRGQTGKLARRNAMRNPRRTAGSASALMVGTAVVALFTSFGASITASIEDVVDESFGGDLIIEDDNWSGAGLSPNLAGDVRDLPEVQQAVGIGYGVGRLDGDEVSPAIADAPVLDELWDLDVVQGDVSGMNAASIMVSDQYAEDNGIGLGDVVPMEFADGASEQLTVAAVYETREPIGSQVIMPELWQQHGSTSNDIVVMIDLADGVSEEVGAAAVDEVGAQYSAPEVMTRDQFLDSIGEEVDQMLFFVYGMLGVAILIALMGIANTLSLSIHERTRELGLLRAVGQTRPQVRSTIRWESVIVAVFGTIGGIGLGTFLGWGLMRAMAESEGFGTFVVPVVPLAVVLGLAAVAGVVAALRPARRAAKLDVLTAIATE